MSGVPSPYPRGTPLTPGYWTISVTVVLWLSPPLAPVIVSAYEPGSAVPVATASWDETVAGTVVLGAAGLGANAPVAPLGSPPTVSVTRPEKPLLGLRVTP